MIPLHLEVGDIYVIEEEKVILLTAVCSISPVPHPNSIFKWDSSKEFLCQLDKNVCIMFSFLVHIHSYYYHRIMTISLLLTI